MPHGHYKVHASDFDDSGEVVSYDQAIEEKQKAEIEAEAKVIREAKRAHKINPRKPVGKKLLTR